MAYGLALAAVGATHFVFPGYFETLVPIWLPKRHQLVLLSGIAEIAIGVGLVIEQTRAPAAWAAVALMVTYVLTHIDALWRSSPEQGRWLDRPLGAAARVAANVGYLALAVYIAVSG